MSLKVGELYADITLRDQEFNRTVDGAHRKFGGLGSAIQSTGAKIGAGLVAFGIGRWLAGSIDVVHQYEVTIARLKTVVEATGGSWGVYSEKMKDVVDKQSQISAFSGGELRGSLADLTQVTGDASKGLDLLALTTDLARGKQMDLQTASKLVGKVAMGNYGVLARYGIIIAKGTSATDALAQLQARFAGQAKAYGDTSAGAQDKLSNALKKLQLTVGTAVVPALTTLAGITVVVLNHFNSLPGPVKTVLVAIAGLATAAALLAPFVQTIAGIVTGLRAISLIKLVGPLGRFKDGFQDAKAAASAFSGKAGTLGGNLRKIIDAAGGWITKVPGLIAANSTAALSYGALGLAAAGAGVAIWQMMDAAIAYEDQMRKVDDATKTNLKNIDALIVRYRTLGKDTSGLEKDRLSIIKSSKVSTPWYYYLDPAYALGEGAAKLASGRGMSSGGYVPPRPGGTQVTLGEGGKGEWVTPDSKMGGGSIVVKVEQHFHGPVVGGKAGMRELSGMVQRDVMSGVRRGLVGQNA